MNKFIGLFIGVIALAALAGAAIGWRFPFLGQNRQANQIGASQEAVENQPTGQVPIQRANQPTRTTAQAPSNTQRTAQAPSNIQRAAQAQQTTVGQAGTGNTQPVQSNANEPIRALW